MPPDAIDIGCCHRARRCQGCPSCARRLRRPFRLLRAVRTRLYRWRCTVDRRCAWGATHGSALASSGTTLEILTYGRRLAERPQRRAGSHWQPRGEGGLSSFANVGSPARDRVSARVPAIGGPSPDGLASEGHDRLACVRCYIWKERDTTLSPYVGLLEGRFRP